MILIDNKGFFSLVDGILAISILLTGLLIFTIALDFDHPSSQDTFSDSKLANDAMESMVLTFDEDNFSTIDSIVYILRSNNNNLDKNSKKMLANIAGTSLNKTLSNKNYLLVENNILNGETIASKGDILESSNITTTTRNFGEYSFTLSVF